ncbi:MAG TPA: DUF72 domain-containing protein [Rhizomicrobium sp.]|nr:DUF72 domain-containing protein [Rhizomicrobium sp.]
MQIYIGTAGWAIPSRHAGAFPGSGTHLTRYARRLGAVEINSSFYKPHQRKTYERWAASVPQSFRFSVKLPRRITHELRLKNFKEPLDRFVEEISGLGDKLAVILVQLPPSLAYDATDAEALFQTLGRKARAMIACEPRHGSWFTLSADSTLQRLHVARVAADPPRVAGGGEPGGWQGLRYWRLHGSPKIYYSAYSSRALTALAARLQPSDWCIFDNTAAFAALANARELKDLTV